MLKLTGRYALLILGWISFAAGLVGLALPVIPTVPFLIVSAFCFSRSSPRLHNWIIRRPNVGPQIKDWEDYGVIRRRTKLYATLTITLGAIYPLGFGPFALELKVIFVCVLASVLLFIWTRPEVKPEKKA